jgi:hypothetical protein
MISQDENQAPNNDANTPHNISSNAVGIFHTNLAPPEQTIPKTNMRIPQKNTVTENTGAKISQKMPNIPAIPSAIKIKPPIIAIIKPIFAKERIIFIPPRRNYFYCFIENV